MGSKKYKTLIDVQHLTKTVRLNDSIAILRTNNNNIHDIFEILNSKNKYYYIHFLDGDKWKERDLWKENQFIDKYDFDTAYDLFRLSPYKDCVFQWMDEFIIVSPYDLTEKITELLEKKDFTMTRLVYKTINSDFSDVARLSNIVREKKELGRGKSYYIESL